MLGISINTQSTSWVAFQPCLRPHAPLEALQARSQSPGHHSRTPDWLRKNRTKLSGQRPHSYFRSSKLFLACCPSPHQTPQASRFLLRMLTIPGRALTLSGTSWPRRDGPRELCVKGLCCGSRGCSASIMGPQKTLCQILAVGNDES